MLVYNISFLFFIFFKRMLVTIFDNKRRYIKRRGEKSAYRYTGRIQQYKQPKNKHKTSKRLTATKKPEVLHYNQSQFTKSTTQGPWFIRINDQTHKLQNIYIFNSMHTLYPQKLFCLFPSTLSKNAQGAACQTLSLFSPQKNSTNEEAPP